MFDCLQAKDLPGLRDLLREVPDGIRVPFGGPSCSLWCCGRARQAPDRPAGRLEIHAALDDLEQLAAVPPISRSVSIWRISVATTITVASCLRLTGEAPRRTGPGGRYDSVGRAFGEGARRRVSVWICASWLLRSRIRPCLVPSWHPVPGSKVFTRRQPVCAKRGECSR